MGPTDALRRALGPALGLAAALVTLTAFVAVTGPASTSPLRHAYFIPVLAGALRFGVAGGVLAAGAAILLIAPFVLSDIERTGFSAGAADGLVTFAVLLLVGGLSGALRTAASRQKIRYEAVVAIQRALAEEVPLDLALGRVRAVLADRLGASALAVIVRDGERWMIAGAEAVGAGSMVSQVLARGVAAFVPDTGSEVRPRRAFVAPLRAGGEVVGALALERLGELGGDERVALEALAAHLGLALENARLASRQRRFAGELREKIAAATRGLEEMDRAKSAFVAIVSHELRTPLTSLAGFSELLAVRRLPAGEVQRIAEIIQRETERLVRIVSDLLDLSRLDRGLAPALRRAPVAVEPALAAAIDLFRRGSPTHRLRVVCAPDLARVDADPDALDRVLKNLVANAIKYSPAGTTVEISARPAPPDAVEFAVTDEGRGIPPDALPHVFEPYYRAPDAARAARGAGIGLAVVRSLVEAHGGAIRVESAPIGGKRVTFTLPAVP